MCSHAASAAGIGCLVAGAIGSDDRAEPRDLHPYFPDAGRQTPGTVRFSSRGGPVVDEAAMSRGEPSQTTLRAPGQFARERGLELAFRPVLIGLLALLAMLIAWQVIGLRGIPLVLFELSAIGVMVIGDRFYSDQADRWLRGAKGEQAVGAICAELESDGWYALHGVSFGRGDIDHVLIGPGGVFTIETKSYGGRLAVDRIYPDTLKQAYRHKKCLETVTGLEVHPLLVYSRAYLVGSVPAQRRGVTILPARVLRHYFSRRRPTLNAAEAIKLHSRLTAALSNS
jgi:nuclease-like protein